MKKLRILVAGLAVMAAGLFAAPAVMADTCPVGSLREGETVNSLAECNMNEVTGDNKLMNRVNIIINVALGVLGLVAVVMIIMGGLNYTTSAGDAAKVKKAKDTITYGVIGLVVALLAFAIVNFVLTSAFGNGTSSSSSSQDSNSSSSQNSNASSGSSRQNRSSSSSSNGSSSSED